MVLFFFLVFDQKYLFGQTLPKKLNGKFKLQFGTRDWGTWGDLPDYLKNLLVLSGPLIVLAQKRWFCNFHTVFGHIAPIPPPLHKLTLMENLDIWTDSNVQNSMVVLFVCDLD